VFKLLVAGINLLNVYCGVAGAEPVPFHINSSTLLPSCPEEFIVIMYGERANMPILLFFKVFV